MRQESHAIAALVSARRELDRRAEVERRAELAAREADAGELGRLGAAEIALRAAAAREQLALRAELGLDEQLAGVAHAGRVNSARLHELEVCRG